MSKFVISFLFLSTFLMPHAVIADDNALDDCMARLGISNRTTTSEIKSLYAKVAQKDHKQLHIEFDECDDEEDLRYYIKAFTPGTGEYDDYKARHFCCGLGWFLTHLDGGFDKYGDDKYAKYDNFTKTD